MDARQLRYFLAAVDAEGFGRAADQLFIAQPSLSQTIAGLERELGVVLFHRLGRGVEIISMPSPGIEPLAAIMQRFAAAHPEVTVSVDAAFVPDEVIQAVRSGAAELGLLGAPEPVHAADLDVMALADQRLVLITAAGGPFAGRDHITVADLDGHRLVASQRGSLMRHLVDDVLARGINARLVAEVAHRTSILPLVLAGVADAILPDSWSELARRAGAEVLAIHPAAHLRVALVSRRTQLTPAAQAFVDAARDHQRRTG